MLKRKFRRTRLRNGFGDWGATSRGPLQELAPASDVGRRVLLLGRLGSAKQAGGADVVWPAHGLTAPDGDCLVAGQKAVRNLQRL